MTTSKQDGAINQSILDNLMLLGALREFFKSPTVTLVKAETFGFIANAVPYCLVLVDTVPSHTPTPAPSL